MGDLIEQLEPAARPLASRFDEKAAAGLPMDLGEYFGPALYSAAISLKRIADALDSTDMGGKPQGSVLWWLESLASSAERAGRG